MSETSPRLTPTNTQAAQPPRPWWGAKLPTRPASSFPSAPAPSPAGLGERALRILGESVVPTPRPWWGEALATRPASSFPPAASRAPSPAASRAQALPAPRVQALPGQPLEPMRSRVDDSVMGELQSQHGFDPGLLNSRAAWMNAGEQTNAPQSTLVLQDSPLGERPEHTLSPYTRVAGHETEGQPTTPTPPFRPRAAERPLDQRATLLANTYQLSQEEYDALSDQQKAVIQFNTGMVEAARADDVAGNTDASVDFLSALGITPQSEAELDEFLQLDRLVGEKILEKLGDPKAVQSAADTMRWARGDAPSAGDARHISNALSIGELTTPRVAQQLANLGTPSTTATTATTPGFGTSRDDLGIQRVYLNMIDSRYDLSLGDIEAGIAQQNATDGTNVTLDQVLDYLNTRLQSATFNRQGKDDSKLAAPTFDSISGEAFTPLDIAEIRRRYGL